ncbi:MAG: rhodanese [archaeon GW2011_AR5]|nr:MAG: rhodanese [archaeon GW2011_AR5]
MATIKSSELKKKLDSGEKLVILDVREPFEFVDWHIPGAINVPVSRVMRNPELDVPKDSEIIAVCAHGMRSAAATRYLIMAGFENVSSLEGGMVEWNGVYDVVRINENVLQIRRIGKGCLGYVIAGGGEAVVIDPTVDIDVFIRAAGASRITAVLDTHAHADHASGGRMLAKKLGIPYYAPSEVGVTETIFDGDEIPFGSLALKAVAAPGHTPGSLVYHVNRFLFTGDTLFTDSVGRPDLGQEAGEASPVLYDTVQKLLAMPDNTLVLPAHAEIENIKHGTPIIEALEEVKELPALRKSREEFVQWLAGFSRPAPENFEILKEYNTGKIVIDSIDEFRELEAGANRCAVK